MEERGPVWQHGQTATRIDGGLDVQAALEQPRWTVWPGSYPREVGQAYELRVEDRPGESTISALGHSVKTTGDWGAGGGAQIIARDSNTGVIAGRSVRRAERLALGI